MSVRESTIDDLGDLVRLGATFHAATPAHQKLPFDEPSFRRFCEQALDNPDIGFWVVEQDGKVAGMTAAIIYPTYFNVNCFIAQELFWWVDEQARGSGAGKELIEAIEGWARKHKVDAVFMLALADKNEEKMQNLYARRGYRPIERTFMKEVL